jgi:hypothetical protein
MMKWLFALVLVAALVGVAEAQRGRVRRDPLTDKEVEIMREYRDQPDKRVRAMTGFIRSRADRLDKLVKDPTIKPSERGTAGHDLLEDITNLLDEFNDNVDTFLKEEADIRKPLNEALVMENSLLSQLQAMQKSEADKPWFADYKFELETAIDAAQQSLKDGKDAAAEDEKIVKEAKERAKKQVK